VTEASAGDIVVLSGLDDIAIGDTVADPENPEAMPRIAIEEPTMRMTFSVNDSPFAGREGKYSTSRHLRARLMREIDVNLGLRVDETDSPDSFLVSGRGELHLAVLIETMRREGYEFAVSQPEVIFKEVEGHKHEPVEHLTTDIPDEFTGAVTEALGKRRGEMAGITYDDKGGVRLEYLIPTRGLIGFRNAFLTMTGGNGVMSSLLLGYRPYAGDLSHTRNGALTASQSGTAVPYGLANAQERGTTFIDPGTQVYQGMIVGVQKRPKDIAVNVCKEKQKTNIRSSTADIAVRLTPPVKMSLEQCLDFLEDDELLEVTPKHIRLRKRWLTELEAKRSAGRLNPDR
jgi:GTP-binding protein